MSTEFLAAPGEGPRIPVLPLAGDDPALTGLNPAGPFTLTTAFWLAVVPEEWAGMETAPAPAVQAGQQSPPPTPPLTYTPVVVGSTIALLAGDHLRNLTQELAYGMVQQRLITAE